MAQLFAGIGLQASVLLPFLLLGAIVMAGQWRESVAALWRPNDTWLSLGLLLIYLLVLGAFLVLFSMVGSWDRFLTPLYALILLQGETCWPSPNGDAIRDHAQRFDGTKRRR